MSSQAVKVTGINPVTEDTDGGKLVAVSSNAADTGNLSISGLYSSAGQSETLALLGRREVATTNLWDALYALSMSAAPAGTVTIRKAGSPAIGYVVAGATPPADGDTLILGLTGFTQTYTFRNPGRKTITCPAGGGASLVTTALSASYIKITIAGTSHYFWFSNGTTIDPTPGGTGHAVTFTGAYTQAQLQTALTTALAASNPGFLGITLESGVLTVTGYNLGTITMAQDGGNDFTFGTTAAGTADAANQIRTGWDTSGNAMTALNLASYIDLAIRATTLGGIGAGVYWGTGTVANSFLTSSASVGTVTMTDNVACLRSLGWNCSVTGTGVTLVSPAGGVNGDEAGVLTPGATTAYNDLTFDSEGADVTGVPTTVTLPALLTPTSDEILVGGKQVTFEALKGAGGSTIAWKVQTSTGVADDGAQVWRDCATTPGVITTTLVRFTPVELIDRARVVITTNANTVARPVNIKAVF